MSAVLLFIVGTSIGFLFPWPRTLLAVLLIPLYYLGVQLSLWGSGLGGQWFWAMSFLIATSFAAIVIGILLGGGNRFLNRKVTR